MWTFILANIDVANDQYLSDAANTVQSVASASNNDIGANFTKMILTFALLIFCLYASYWAIKKLINNRLEKGSTGSSIHILEKKMLSVKTMLYLVEVDQKKILITESQVNIKKIESLPNHTALESDTDSN